ncbi:MAG: molybdenum cofactor guanylyltransferase, partial [Candidatus Omnitrophota bacterium]
MPFLHNGLVERLLVMAQDEECGCIIPRSERGIEPLCAIYSKDILPELEKSLYQDDLSIRRFLKLCGCRHVEVSKDEGRTFINLNTPQDLEKARAHEG